MLLVLVNFSKLIQTLEALLVLLGRVYLTSVDLGLECLLFVSLLVELHLFLNVFLLVLHILPNSHQAILDFLLDSLILCHFYAILIQLGLES